MSGLVLLCVGPRFTTDVNSLGGTTKSFETFLSFLENEQVVHTVIPSNQYDGFAAGLKNTLYAISECVRHVRQSNCLFLSGSVGGALVLAPLLNLLARWYNVQFAYRMFGGDIGHIYNSANWVVEKLLKVGILKAAPLFLQTKALVDQFQKECACVCYLPTSRPKPLYIKPKGEYRKRILFIGQIRKEKGVDLVLEFRQKHLNNYVVDLYGPIIDDEYVKLDEDAGYQGALQPEQLSVTLEKYDLLVLPTFYPGEGYPGVLIEANQHGLPVISTLWQNIPEIVNVKKSGLLVPANDFKAFEAAILAVTDVEFQEMSQYSLEWSEQFDSNCVYKQLLSDLKKYREAKQCVA